ncbi:MAG: 30S ribosomal protein S16 [Candidatus Obscuribacterales bacterium]|nr:30S ribosomal protein S16 [Candidatus Obscuribacterales bacterium]
MVKIRLKRIGAKKAPHYRIVAVDGRTRRDGKPIEEVGYYNPRSKELRLDREAVERWMKNGAQPSDTVAGLIRKADAAAAGTAAAQAAGTAAGAAAKGASKAS